MDATARGGRENGPSGRNGAGSPPSLRLNCCRSHLSLALAIPLSLTFQPTAAASLLHIASRSPCLLPPYLQPISGLIDRLKGSRLQELDVRHYPRAILKMKIADLKLIGKVGEAATLSAYGGTPLYIVPECTAQGEYVPTTNIWSLGCVVEEMAVGGEPPEIPLELSKARKDFLEKCFVRDLEKRWTGKMLLNHQFVAEEVAVALGGDSQRHRMIAIEKTTSLFWNDYGNLGQQLETGSPPSILSWGNGEWITIREAEVRHHLLRRVEKLRVQKEAIQS
ncbi:Serine/threonine-protein kinase 36 [Asimina triloba]